ncbi:MAG: PH domain-containing protein [Propionibacteriaceae bacterium]|nr:PH domain-containing protein [Propionibacteriaceae bacterium]
MAGQDEMQLHRLPVVARRYWLVNHLVNIAVTVAIGVGVVLGFNWSPWWLLVPGGIVVLHCLGLMLIPLRYAHYGYRVNSREVFVTTGRIIRRSVTVAAPKVLNAEVSQGPIQRWFGLSSVSVNQVVGEHEIGPVRPEEAERLRREILAAAGRETP